MTAFVRQPTDLVDAHPSLAGLVIFVSAASEAIVVVSAVIPGTSILLGIATLAGAVHISIWPPVLRATAGGIVGEWLSYLARPKGLGRGSGGCGPCRATAPTSRSADWSSASRSLPSPACSRPARYLWPSLAAQHHATRAYLARRVSCVKLSVSETSADDP